MTLDEIKEAAEVFKKHGVPINETIIECIKKSYDDYADQRIIELSKITNDFLTAKFHESCDWEFKFIKDAEIRYFLAISSINYNYYVVCSLDLSEGLDDYSFIHSYLKAFPIPKKSLSCHKWQKRPVGSICITPGAPPHDKYEYVCKFCKKVKDE